MFAESCQECLHNAQLLLNDAKKLMNTQSYGVAQSLSVIAYEEVGKAVILGLADLDRVPKSVVVLAMKKHPPKKIILIGIEQSKLLLGKELANEATELILDKANLEKFEKEMNTDVQELENIRQQGFYVDVDVTNGVVKNSPRNVEPTNAQSFVNRAEIILQVGRALCRLFRDIQKRTRSSLRIKEVRIPKYMWTGNMNLGRQPDYTLTIVWDEM